MANNTTRLMCVGLGSCVALVLHDPHEEVGGVAHIMLPSREEAKSQTNPAKFADSCVELMISELKDRGANPRRLKARLYGGANMFPRVPSRGLPAIGDRNIEAIRRELEKQHIEIVEEDTGGTAGRSIVFNPKDGSVEVKYVHSQKEVYGRRN